MKGLRLILALVFMVPAWPLLGAFSTLDSRLPLRWGLTVGGAIGVFFGLILGGNHKWWFWDYIYGP